MNINIVDVLRFHTCIFESILHHKLSTQTLRMRSSDMMSISTHTSTNHLSIYLSTTSLCMLQLLKNQTASTLSHDESIATGTERTACLFWLIITS